MVQMRRLLVAAALIASACAPRIVPPPVVTTPKFPEFVRPSVPDAFANGPAAINESRGWAFLQNGDLKTAEHEFTAALKNDPRFYPAETSLAYLELAKKDPKAALPRFDRVLEQQASDLAALSGRAQTLLALERDAEALEAFKRVLAADPNQPEVRRRVDVLTFRLSEEEIAHARQAARGGRLDEAVRAYTNAIAGSPDSPFLYRELAGVERQQGDADAALAHFRKAVELDATDARSLVQIGEILEERGAFDEAAQSYAEAAAIDPSDEIERKLEAVREKSALARLPAEYRAIEGAAQITRADLAALIGIRLAPLLQSGTRSDAALITDVRSNWAQTWIMAVARAGVMEPFANHAFQPRTVVRRADFAQTVARLLTHVAAIRPSAASAWESARLRFADLAPSHLAYPAVSAAVASGVMKVGPDNAFHPSRAVTGQEAIDAITRLESLADLR
jgi:tetratricopeptide (TPR) repeat protein